MSFFPQDAFFVYIKVYENLEILEHWYYEVTWLKQSASVLLFY